jgi:hypothetical protein
MSVRKNKGKKKRKPFFVRVKGRFESIDIRAKNLFFFSFELFFIEYAEEEESEEEAEKIIIEKKTIIFHSTGGPPNLFNVGLYMLRALCVYIYRRGGGRSGFTFDRIFTHTHTAVCTLYVSGVASNAHTIFCVEFQRAYVLFIPSYPFFLLSYISWMYYLSNICMAYSGSCL